MKTSASFCAPPALGMGSLSPILWLYPDIWTRITELLHLEAILKLFKLGNTQLSAIVRPSIHRVFWSEASHVLDVEAFLRHCGHLPSLREIAVSPTGSTALVKRPSAPLAFPSTLTSLYLSFEGAFSLVAPLKLSELLPGLVSLRLEGWTHHCKFEFEDFDIPPLLECLQLLPWLHSPELRSEFVSRLPRKLLKLELRCKMTHGSSETPLVFDWPPSLEHCDLASEGTLVLEHLPRTVTYLQAQNSGSQITSTTFPQPKLELEERLDFPGAVLVFPWRRFFPRLQTLALRSPRSGTLALSPLLSTIVLDMALDTLTVDRFIESGFWNVESLRHIKGTWKDPFPTFKSITLPTKVWELPETVLVEQFKALAPHLTNTEFPRFRGPLTVARFLPRLSSITMFQDITGEPILLPSVLTITGADEVCLASLSPTLTHLHCKAVIPGPSGSIGALPPKLTYLHLQQEPLPDVLHSMLPVTLTTLHIHLSSTQHWALIAERLVLLKDLAVTLHPLWSCESALTPISSSCLKRFALMCENSFDSPPEKPHLVEFFSSPSIFPPSLKDLSLFESSWHASILAAIPPNLHRLSIVGFFWQSRRYPNIVPYPEGLDLSKEELLDRLSPRLEDLRLSGLFSTSEETALPSIKLVKHLPHSLRSVEAYCIFSVDIPEEEVLPLLPRHITNCGIESVSPKPKQLRPTGYLN